MTNREFLAVVMAAVSWLTVFTNLAFYWRFGAPADWVLRLFDRGSIEQVGVLVWLVVLLVLIQDED